MWYFMKENLAFRHSIFLNCRRNPLVIVSKQLYFLTFFTLPIHFAFV